MKVKIVQEVKRSDGLWRFACGKVSIIPLLRLYLPVKVVFHLKNLLKNNNCNSVQTKSNCWSPFSLSSQVIIADKELVLFVVNHLAVAGWCAASKYLAKPSAWWAGLCFELNFSMGSYLDEQKIPSDHPPCWTQPDMNLRGGWHMAAWRSTIVHPSTSWHNQSMFADHNSWEKS